MYIVIELQTSAQGTVGNFVWAFASENEAFSKYHTVLAAAAVSELPCHSCVTERRSPHRVTSTAKNRLPNRTLTDGQERRGHRAGAVTG